MKVLLTGASGFVGSHILDRLCEQEIPAVILLRAKSDRSFIAGQVSRVEIRTGSIEDVDSLKPALRDVTHVIHCAGCTKARTHAEFYAVNQGGTRNVVAAVNGAGAQIQRLLHVSSLAVTGPAPAHRPAREGDPLKPLSEYGRSKLAAEQELLNCRIPHTVIRPPAVYGPRDRGFLPMFKAVKSHLRPQPSASQALSVVYGPDLAAAVVTCLAHPQTSGKIYFAASGEVLTARAMADAIARQMKRWTVPLPLPAAMLWPVCFGQEVWSRLTGKAMLLNLQKYAELRAPGWVCDSAQLKADTGCECRTPLEVGIAETIRWYEANHWL